MVFLDTSALYALADRADKNHKKAKEVFSRLIHSGEALFTHNYILIETAALIQHRLGLAPAHKFLQEAFSFHITWVNFELHTNAFEYFTRWGKRKVSFVDCVSFVLMAKEKERRVFAFDDDFVKADFALL